MLFKVVFLQLPIKIFTFTCIPFHPLYLLCQHHTVTISISWPALTSLFSFSLFRKPFDGGKRTMDHGSQQQQTQQMPGPFTGYAGPQGPYPGQHPALLRLDEVQREIASLGPQVCYYSGLQSDREYKRLERELTRLLLEVDKVRTGHQTF